MPDNRIRGAPADRVDPARPESSVHGGRLRLGADDLDAPEADALRAARTAPPVDKGAEGIAIAIEEDAEREKLLLSSSKRRALGDGPDGPSAPWDKEVELNEGAGVEGRIESLNDHRILAELAGAARKGSIVDMPDKAERDGNPRKAATFKACR